METYFKAGSWYFNDGAVYGPFGNEAAALFASFRVDAQKRQKPKVAKVGVVPMRCIYCREVFGVVNRDARGSAPKFCSECLSLSDALISLLPVICWRPKNRRVYWRLFNKKGGWQRGY